MLQPKILQYAILQYAMGPRQASDGPARILGIGVVDVERDLPVDAHGLV